MKADRIVLGIAVVIIGMVWLLVNLGVIPAAAARELWRYWPLLLILWGVLLLLGKDNSGITGLLVALLVVALVGGGFFSYLTSSGPKSAQTFETTISNEGNVRAVNLQLIQHAGELELTSHPGSDLVALKLQTQVQPKISHKQEEETAEILVKDQDDKFNFDNRVSHWQLSLAEQLPLQLTLHTGATKANLDFSHLLLEELEIKAGAGDIDLRLGQTDCEITIESGASEITIYIPDNVGVRLRTSGALMSIDSDEGRMISVGDRSYFSKELETKDAVADIHITAAAGKVKLRHDHTARVINRYSSNNEDVELL
ncbi:MAG TPA: hypothetical protein DCE00_05690 [Firmicutes bacterium]|jgi:hypothetical protein|nr:hypothetical protein [Bacillota bacterium]HAA38346.1 hypothetical protein [Bacillota bacterium]